MRTTHTPKHVGRRTLVATVTVSLAAVAALLQTTPAAATFPGRDGRIAYTFDDPSRGPHDIYSVLPNGSGRTALTNDGLHEASPSYSPDGQQIAFISTRDGNPEVYVMNADGTAVTRVTNTPTRTEGEPSFSPDGQQLVFTAVGDQVTPCCGTLQQHLFVINVDGSGERQLTSGNVNDSSPVFSPTGSQIAFSRFVPQSNGTTDIFVVGSSGGQATNITSQYDRKRGLRTSEFYSPDYSPNGRRLVVVSNAKSRKLGGLDIYVLRANGQGLVRLFHSRPDEYEAVFSPDAREIAYTSFGGHEPEGLYVMRANGDRRHAIVVTHSTQRIESPTWQPVP